MEHTQSQVSEKTKAAGVLDAPEAASEDTAQKQDTTTKNYAMLTAFVNAGERGINCFEAANNLHDYVLRTTVSILQKRYGFEILREMEQVPNFKGGKTSVKRYWLDDYNLAIAKAIIQSAEASNE